MSVYYQDALVTLYHGDAYESMASLADQSIDLVLADPPYGTTNIDWDQALDLALLWTELHRLCTLHASQVLFSAQPFTTDLIISNRERFRYELIWPKPMATGFLRANKRPLQNHENICVFCQKPGKSTYNPQKSQGHEKYKRTSARASAQYNEFKNSTRLRESVNGERHPVTVLPAFSRELHSRSLHPTAKPVPLMAWLVATYSNPGDLILDPFAGSGSTLVAAKQLGRRCIGIEMNERYCEIAATRLYQDCMEVS